MTKAEYIKQARAKEEQAFATIRGMAESFREDPKKLAQYFAFGAQFYHYSPRNIMLVMAQNPGATYVDSYKGWEEKGAHVLKGAKSLQILVPVTVTYLETEKGWVALSRASEELKEQYQIGMVASEKKQCYKLGNVFDISQTSFPKERYPELFSMGYPSELHEDICRGLKDFAAEELGGSVMETDLESIRLLGQYVHSISPIIRLNEKLESTQKLSNLSNELGHALVHRGNPEYSKARKEFEADAFSIMLCAAYGVEITEPRREHLANHYRAFEQECIQGTDPKELDKIREEKMMESFSRIFAVYQEHAEKIGAYVDRYVPDISLEASEEPVYMTEDEFLGEYRSPVCDYMLDKQKLPHGLSKQDEKRLHEEFSRRQSAWKETRREKMQEYRRLVDEGKIIEKTAIQRSVETARSPLGEREAVQAARRMCKKRGIDWNTYVLPWEKDQRKGRVETLRPETENVCFPGRKRSR